jgi:hypothetical protein
MAVAVEKAASALKLASEIEKLQTDLSKLNEEIVSLRRGNESAPKRERSERLRDYIALLTPLVTIITLSATLITQNWQFLRSERTKQEDALDARWQEAVKTISATGALSPGVIALQPFLRSQKYEAQAKDVAINLLSNSSDATFFASLFGTAITPISWNNMESVLKLDRALNARYGPLLGKTWNPNKQINDISLLTKDELATYNYVNGVAPTLTSQIGSVLKMPKPLEIHVDLSATYFTSGDWQGVNLDGTNLEGIDLRWTSLKNAKLENITQFSGAFLYRTAWWEAKSISRPLLEFLKKTSPFEPNATYGPRNEEISQEAYDADIQRLTLQLK